MKGNPEGGKLHRLNKNLSEATILENIRSEFAWFPTKSGKLARTKLASRWKKQAVLQSTLPSEDFK